MSIAPGPHRRTLPRLLMIMLILVAGLLVSPTARACACGAVEPSRQGDLGVSGETAAIVFDGRRQTTVVSMGLRTDGPEAAFLMPVPGEAEVSVGADRLFTELFDYTRPEPRTRYVVRGPFTRDGGPGGGAPTGGVDVVGRQRVGDYDVVQLTGTADAVGAWLATNGFRVRDEVVAGLGDYLSQGWVVLAARLAFDTPSFSGEMRPLQMRFATDRIVYPMRLSALADVEQRLRLYVFADHRVTARVGGIDLRATFAGWVDRAALSAAGAPAAGNLIAQDRYLLTRFDQTLSPEGITSDLVVEPDAAGDREFRSTYDVERDVTEPVLLGVGVLLALIMVAGVTTVARRR